MNRRLIVAMLVLVPIASAQNWRNVPVPKSPLLPFKPGTTALQLTDGSIMVQEFESSHWWKLTPDDKVDYSNGTWSQLESSKAFNAKGELEDYAPRLCASAVLPDGRVIVEGGEYEYGSGTEVKDTTKGAIYNPFTGHWTPQAPPPGWKQIGDAPSIVLPDGTYLLGNINSKEVAFLGALTGWNWTLVNPTGKYDQNSEEGWILLPSGKVLTIDTYINAAGKGVPSSPATLPNNSEVFDPSTEMWSSAGNTVAPLSNLQAICPLTSTGGYVTGGHEVGPAILRPDGTVFATGVYVCGKGEGGGGGAGHTSIYQELSLTGVPFWIAGPDIPCEGTGAKKVCNDMADAPAALLINGNVLVQTSPGLNQGHSTFYEFDFITNAFSPVIKAPPGFTQGNSEQGRMLVNASGHLFYMRPGEAGEMWFYVPQGTYNPVWAPIVTNVSDNGICVGCVDRGQTYTVSGNQLNGLSGGAAYGDDAQSASNYPLVLMENCENGKKYFAPTHDFSTMGVATGTFNVVTAKFDVLPSTPKGTYKLVVIANGIPSQPYQGSCAISVY